MDVSALLIAVILNRGSESKTRDLRHKWRRRAPNYAGPKRSLTVTTRFLLAFPLLRLLIANSSLSPNSLATLPLTIYLAYFILPLTSLLVLPFALQHRPRPPSLESTARSPPIPDACLPPLRRISRLSVFVLASTYNRYISLLLHSSKELLRLHKSLFSQNLA
ncbi:hypothetical protein BDV11DRAFT_117605 [Aspergillus similis]